MRHLSCIWSLSFAFIRMWNGSLHRDLMLGGFPLSDVVGTMGNVFVVQKVKMQLILTILSYSGLSLPGNLGSE